MKKSIFLGAAMLLLMAACSNDENNNGQEKPIQAVQFSFTNEDFGADETLTRATSAAETKSQIVDLGDCEAEISVESEPAVKTRGTLTNANGHYTIRAYQSGTLKGEVKGTFSGGAFTADANSRKSMRLPDGTYDFVAFNDDVVPSGTELTVAKDKAATAMMGTTTELISQHPDQKVNFTMKHVGCRLRTQFVCQKHIPNAITATLEPTGTNVIPTSVSYDPATKAYTGTPGAMASKVNNSPASTEEIYTASAYGKNYSYISASDYHYFLPTTEGSKLKLTGISAGTIFWKPIPSFNVPKLNATFQMQAGKSYAVKIKIKPNFTYLMSDGTTGFFKETIAGGGTRTPIALVFNKTKHLAVALKYANGTNECPWTSNALYESQQLNTNMKTTFTEALAMENGYEETWDGSCSTAVITGEKVKGERPDFPAFYRAAHYNPGVTVTGANVSKWYLPAYGELKYMFTELGFGDLTQVTNYGHYKWYGNLISAAIQQVGGDDFSLNAAYWTSTEIMGPYGFPYAGLIEMYGNRVYDDAHVGWSAKAHMASYYYNTAVVRAFVKY